MLVILNLPLVSIFVNVLKLPSKILRPIVLLLCTLGAYSVNNSVMDVWIMTLFGFLGFLMRKAKFDPAPLALPMVIGPMMEIAFRQSLIISRGESGYFHNKTFLNHSGGRFSCNDYMVFHTNLNLKKIFGGV